MRPYQVTVHTSKVDTVVTAIDVIGIDGSEYPIGHGFVAAACPTPTTAYVDYDQAVSGVVLHFDANDAAIDAVLLEGCARRRRRRRRLRRRRRHHRRRRRPPPPPPPAKPKAAAATVAVTAAADAAAA